MADDLDYMQTLQRLISQSAGLSRSQSVDEQIRRTFGAFSESRDTPLDRAIRELVGRPDHVQEWLQVIAPYSGRTFLDEAERQRSRLEEHLGLGETRSTLAKLIEEISGGLTYQFNRQGASPLQQTVLGEIDRIRLAMEGITTPSSSAALAVAMESVQGLAFAAHNDVHVSAIMANPLAISTRMIREASESLDADDSPLARSVTERSLSLVGAQLRDSTETALSLGAPDDDIVVRTPARRLCAPHAQRRDLRKLRHELQDLELDELLVVTPTGQIVLLAREVVSLAAAVNEQAVVFERNPIFKMTARVMRVCVELPFVLPVDEKTFAEAIDDLYFLLYEAPGGGSLRYRQEHGGPLDDDALDVVFVIKNLRSFYRHDLEHGKEGAIRKKFESIASDLSVRGFVSLPRTRADFTRLYRLLLEEAVTLLTRLHSATKI